MITEEQVRQAMRDAGIEAEIDEISADTKLAECGMDSLDFFNLFLELEDLSGKKVGDDEIENLQTINDILKFYADVA